MKEYLRERHRKEAYPKRNLNAAVYPRRMRGETRGHRFLGVSRLARCEQHLFRSHIGLLSNPTSKTKQQQKNVIHQWPDTVKSSEF